MSDDLGMKALWRRLGFHVHEWGMWERRDVDRTLMFYDGRPNVDHKGVAIQWRKCESCGLEQRRDI